MLKMSITWILKTDLVESPKILSFTYWCRWQKFSSENTIYTSVNSLKEKFKKEKLGAIMLREYSVCVLFPMSGQLKHGFDPLQQSLSASG